MEVKKQAETEEVKHEQAIRIGGFSIMLILSGLAIYLGIKEEAAKPKPDIMTTRFRTELSCGFGNNRTIYSAKAPDCDLEQEGQLSCDFSGPVILSKDNKWIELPGIDFPIQINGNCSRVTIPSIDKWGVWQDSSAYSIAPE